MPPYGTATAAFPMVLGNPASSSHHASTSTAPFQGAPSRPHVPNVHKYLLSVGSEAEKLHTTLHFLESLYRQVPDMSAMIVCNSRKSLEGLVESLSKLEHIPSYFLHEDMSPALRGSVLDCFSKIQVLDWADLLSPSGSTDCCGSPSRDTSPHGSPSRISAGVSAGMSAGDLGLLDNGLVEEIPVDRPLLKVLAVTSTSLPRVTAGEPRVNVPLLINYDTPPTEASHLTRVRCLVESQTHWPAPSINAGVDAGGPERPFKCGDFNVKECNGIVVNCVTADEATELTYLNGLPFHRVRDMPIEMYVRLHEIIHGEGSARTGMPRGGSWRSVRSGPSSRALRGDGRSPQSMDTDTPHFP